jgi:hypothetical protein
MKAKSRKRLLISSIAMLLVAMLALGTATFAWFTTSTTATADKIHIKTVQASELQIASQLYNDWGNEIHYNNTQITMKPTSSPDGVHWYTAEAATKTAYDAKTPESGDKFTNVTASPTQYVYTNELNIRNNGAAAVEGVTITFNISETAAQNGKNYVRIAVVPISAHNQDPTAANFQAGIFDLDGVAYNAVTNGTTATTAITPKTTYSITVGDMAGKTDTTIAEKNYKIYAWFEGQDAQCFDTNAGNELPDISFSVSGTTASQT